MIYPMPFSMSTEVLGRSELKIRKGLQHPLLQLIKNRAVRVVQSHSLEVTLDLVTGNPRHFPRFWKQTTVITSREFIGIVAPHLIP